MKLKKTEQARQAVEKAIKDHADQISNLEAAVMALEAEVTAAEEAAQKAAADIDLDAYRTAANTLTEKRAELNIRKGFLDKVSTQPAISPDVSKAAMSTIRAEYLQSIVGDKEKLISLADQMADIGDDILDRITECDAVINLYHTASGSKGITPTLSGDEVYGAVHLARRGVESPLYQTIKEEVEHEG